MYQPSTNYTEYIAQSRIRKPKSKIVVNGTEYTGETALKTYPKINHCTADVLGVFPAKTCEFEIYNKDGNLNLNGKEVAVYRGLDIDGTIEWVPMGLFSGKNEDIVSNSTSKTIAFKGYDRTLMFDVPFNPLNHTYPCTLGSFAKQLCKNHAITLETENFPLSDLILNQAPEITSNVTERELISRIAELGGCIAQISRFGGLRIAKPVKTSNTVSQEKYKSFSYEKQQMITKVVISQTDNEDVAKTADSATIGTYGTVVYCIKDNPFIIDRQNDVISSVATEILGLQARAFSLNDFIDDFLFDLNDIITVKDKNGNDIQVILRSLQTQSRIKSNFSAEVLKNAEEEKTSLAGSQKQANEQNKENLKKFEEQMQQAMQDMSVNINNALGLYSSEMLNADGSRIVYFHDKSTLDTSTYIFTANAEGFAWVSGSGCWNGGSPNWQYGVDSKGGGILSTLLVRELTANVIKTGVLKSVNSPNTYYDLDKGEFNSSSSKSESVVDAETGETITRITRWETSFCNGVFVEKTYVNDTLMYILQTDSNGTHFDQSPMDGLSEEEKELLTIPLAYYEFTTPFRIIYKVAYILHNYASGTYGGTSYFGIQGNNERYTGLSLNSLFFLNTEGVAAFYGSSEARVDTIKAKKTLQIGNDIVVDYIVEQGTSGIWTYRKWASGIAECWGHQKSTATVEWDNSYVACDVEFPILFISKPTINCSGHQQRTVSSYIAMVVSENNYASAYIKCQHEVNDEYYCQFNFYVVGNWK